MQAFPSPDYAALISALALPPDQADRYLSLLASTEQRIWDCRAKIAAQQKRIKSWGGNDANPSRQLLDTLQTTLTMYEQRRAALLERARIVAMNAID